LKSEKIKSIALAIAELHWYQAGRQAGRQAISKRIPLNKKKFKIPWPLFESILG